MWVILIVNSGYVFDEKNKIIAEVTFGPKKRFGKHYKGDKNDFLWGHIYQVSDSFMKKFIKEEKNISPTL
jgi:accessory colonization factor AcfC